MDGVDLDALDALVLLMRGRYPPIADVPPIFDQTLEQVNRNNARVAEVLPALLAHCRALERDAARYRWLRDDAHLDHFAPEEYDDEELIPTAAIDAAIDAARAKVTP